MRRVFIALAVMVLIGPGAAGAATDVAAAGQGNGTLKYRGVTCAAPLAVSINVRSNQAAVTETWGPGTPGVEACAVGTLQFQHEADTTPFPPIQQCLPGGLALTTPNPYVLTQSGTTYTLQSSFRLCSGKQVIDKVSVTVQPTRLVFTHTYAEGGVVLVTASGSVPRLA